MKALWVACILSFLSFGCGNNSSSSPVKSEAVPAPKIVVEKERKERETPPPPEVKIRLKRDGKENYSWELSGTDVDQVLKVNEKMRKQLDEKAK